MTINHLWLFFSFFFFLSIEELLKMKKGEKEGLGVVSRGKRSAPKIQVNMSKGKQEKVQLVLPTSNKIQKGIPNVREIQTSSKSPPFRSFQTDHSKAWMHKFRNFFGCLKRGMALHWEMREGMELGTAQLRFSKLKSSPQSCQEKGQLSHYLWLKRWTSLPVVLRSAFSIISIHKLSQPTTDRSGTEPVWV